MVILLKQKHSCVSHSLENPKWKSKESIIILYYLIEKFIKQEKDNENEPEWLVFSVHQRRFKGL